MRGVGPRSIYDLYDALQGNRFAPGALAPIAYVLFQFVMVNVMLGVFNLIPIPPLDGSGVVVSLVGDSGGPGLRDDRPLRVPHPDPPDLDAVPRNGSSGPSRP